MEVEQLEIRDFLAAHAPFDRIDTERLDRVTASIEIRYIRAGRDIVTLGQTITELAMIRSGAVEIQRRDGSLYSRLGPGELFGQLALMTARPARFPVRALEDTLLYCIPAELFGELFEEEEDFAEYVELDNPARSRAGVREISSGSTLLTTRVHELVHLDPMMIGPDRPVAEAARSMADTGTSAILVTANGEPGELLGILTEHDLTTRVLAQGKSCDTEIGSVMTPDPIPAQARDFVFEAVLDMMRHNVHHLPVLDRGLPVGMINLTDVVSLETRNSLFVVRAIAGRRSLEELKALLPDVRGSFLRMVREDANSHMIGSSLATIGRTFKQRLCELAEEALGPPPVRYCLLALGSMARDEQLLLSDQDNALILDEDYDPALHAEYFKALGEKVCDGLAELGYTYCKGDIMASNPAWRLTLAQWKQHFDRWIARPTPKTLLNASIFFDLDGAAGHTALADELKAHLADRASGHRPFLACLAENARNRTPPLGFFRDFVLEKSGRYQQSLNLKRRGTGPLADVIRVHALAAGSREQNSFRRLDDVQAAGYQTSGMVADLRDALEFLAVTRARHHALALEEEREMNNQIDPETLSTLDRRSLKNAFQILANAQRSLRYRYRQ